MIPSPVNLSTVPSKRSHAVGEDLEEALHDLCATPRVELLGQVHRALHVGEEHGDLLALAFGLDAIATGHVFPIVRPEGTYTGQGTD